MGQGGSSPSARRPDGSTDWIFTLARHPAVPWLIAAVFATCGLVAIRRNTFLNDEGVLTWIFAGLTSEAPMDILFFLKARPPISLLYAPVAAVGLTPFLCAHVLLAATAIPLTASLARHFHHRRPNLPAALLALSPLYFASAAGGVQNSDATVGVLAVAWLLACNRPMTAGLMAGLVVLGRAETLLFALAFAAYAALRADRRGFLIGMAIGPALLTLFGTSYHGHLLWPLLYPPSLTSNAAVAPEDTLGYGGTLNDLVRGVLALTPVVAAVLWTPWRNRSTLERTLTLAAIAFVVVLRVLPFTYLVNVDATPRYILPAVAFLCLAVSGATDAWGRNARSSGLAVALLLGVAALGVAFLERTETWLLLGAIASCIAAAVVAFRSARKSVAILLGAAACGAVLLLPSTRLLLGDQARVLDELTNWLEAAEIPRGGVVVTDYSLLGIWLSRYAPDLEIDLRFLWPPDMRYEVETLTNPTTPQLDRVSHTSRFFYARWMLVDEVASLPGGTYFVLRRENSRRKDLAEPPLNQVEWLVERDWRGGRLSHAPAKPDAP